MRILSPLSSLLLVWQYHFMISCDDAILMCTTLEWLWSRRFDTLNDLDLVFQSRPCQHSTATMKSKFSENGKKIPFMNYETLIHSIMQLRSKNVENAIKSYETVNVKMHEKSQ